MSFYVHCFSILGCLEKAYLGHMPLVCLIEFAMSRKLKLAVEK